MSRQTKFISLMFRYIHKVDEMSEELRKFELSTEIDNTIENFNVELIHIQDEFFRYLIEELGAKK